MTRWLKKVGAFLAVLSLVFFCGPPYDEPTGFAILMLACGAAMTVGRAPRY